MLLGSHVSRATALDDARAIDADVVQVFLSAPQTWASPRPRGDEQALRDSGLALFVHAPYLVNPASLNPDVRAKSRVALEAQAAAAHAIGARGLIVHGGHPTGSGTIADGISGWLEVLDGWQGAVPLLIENTAGGNAAVARRFDAFAQLVDAVRAQGHNVGVCLDTCHAHAGGEGLAGIVERLVAFAGAIDFMHVNDSKDGFDSGRDRHENLGQGQCAIDELLAAVGSANCPAVVETPNGLSAQAADVALLRQALGVERVLE
jgi:deoxyribonuclease-4